MNDTHAPASTDHQSAHVATSRDDRERSLDALHALELHAENAAPGREHDWLTAVRAAIDTLHQALGHQQRNADGEESLLSAVERDEPRLRSRVRHLRQRYRAIHHEIFALRKQLDTTNETQTIDVSDVRQKLERLANELRYEPARETDIVYEAYNVDLGAGD